MQTCEKEESRTRTVAIHSDTSSSAHPSAERFLPLLLPAARIDFQLSSVALTRAFHPTSLLPLGYKSGLGRGARRIANFE